MSDADFDPAGDIVTTPPCLPPDPFAYEHDRAELLCLAFCELRDQLLAWLLAGAAFASDLRHLWRCARRGHPFGYPMPFRCARIPKWAHDSIETMQRCPCGARMKWPDRSATPKVLAEYARPRDCDLRGVVPPNAYTVTGTLKYVNGDAFAQLTNLQVVPPSDPTPAP